MRQKMGGNRGFGLSPVEDGNMWMVLSRAPAFCKYGHCFITLDREPRLGRTVVLHQMSRKRGGEGLEREFYDDDLAKSKSLVSDWLDSLHQPRWHRWGNALWRILRYYYLLAKLPRAY